MSTVKRYTDFPLEDTNRIFTRLLSRCDQYESMDECWKAGDSRWYPTFYNKGKTCMAIRWLWEWVNGPAPEELEPDHLCKNRNCINITHIEWVTHGINVSRGTRRRKTYCIRGHLLPIVKGGRGAIGYQRNCTTCAKAAKLRWKAKNV